MTEKTNSSTHARRAEARSNMVADPDLVAKLDKHRAELSAATGLPVSMSAAAVRLLRRGLEMDAAQPA